MKKNLLLLAAAMAAVSLTTQAEVQYELLPNCNPGKGVKMVFNATSGAYECELGEKDLKSGTIKIVSDDQELIKKYGQDYGLSNPGVWHTQFGTPYTGGVLNVDESAEPMQLTDMYHQLGESGFTPEYIAFAGGVNNVRNAKVQFWPETMKLKIAGEVSDYKEFALVKLPEDIATLPSSGKLGTVLTKLMHTENGIYTGVYDFGETPEMKEFVVAATGNYHRPTYAMDLSGISTQEEGSDESIKFNLAAFSSIAAQKRPAGNGSAKAVDNLIVSPIKTDLTGKYNVRFDSNTGELTLTQDPGGETGVVEMVVETDAPVEYFNMQGMRVENPENGVFIRRQGNKATKVRVK